MKWFSEMFVVMVLFSLYAGALGIILGAVVLVWRLALGYGL